MMHSVSELTGLIDLYAGAVGLIRSPPPGIPGTDEDRVIRWEAPYAQLVLWRIQSTVKARIRDEVEKAQEILDGLLLSAEMRQSGVVDGYLLLFLGGKPDEELHSLIRSLELDTNVCRKSFIWLGEGDSPEARWRRLWRTTVIALPASPPTGSMVELPELKEPYREIWREIIRHGSANAARKELAECRRW
jgi:hypothetical protein